MGPPIKVEKKIAERNTLERGPVPRINTHVIILAPVRGDLGGVIKSCLARVKQYVESVERQRDIMPVGKWSSSTLSSSVPIFAVGWTVTITEQSTTM